MQVTLAHVGSSSGASDPYDAPARAYLKKSIGVAKFTAEAFRSEAALMEWVGKQSGRTSPVTLFLDGRGRQMTSEELAAWLGKRRDEGTQLVIFAIGPADGWSESVRSAAQSRGSLLSLGPMTLAHSLARLVMAEQLYRASGILTGHPYHRGH